MINIIPSSLYAREKSNYNFQFIVKTIPKTANQGSILIDFPSQFAISNDEISCVVAKNFSQFPVCTSYRNRINISGNNFDYVGFVSLNI